MAQTTCPQHDPFVSYRKWTKQTELKNKGLPWELAKGFDGSALVSDMIPKTALPPLNDLGFSLQKNEMTVQSGKVSDMIFSVDEMIAFVSKYFTLKMGDLLFTVTPAGVVPVAINYELKGFLMDREMFRCRVK